MRDWLTSLRESSWDRGQQAFGELVFLRRILQPGDAWTAEQLGAFIDATATPDGMNERVGIAFAAVNLWNDRRYCGVATDALVGLCACSEAPVLQSIADLFRLNDPLPADSSGRRLLDAMIGHSVMRLPLGRTFVLRTLTTLVHTEPGRVSQLSGDIVEGWAARLISNAARHRFDMDELIDIAVTLQRCNPPYRAQGLDLFERLLAFEAYGVEEALVELDGRLARSAPQRSRRRRRSAT